MKKTVEFHSKVKAGKKRFWKKIKSRFERHKAKANPETTPTYGKYKGWALS